MTNSALETDRPLDHLMKLLALEGASGNETEVADYVRKAFLEAGCKKAWIRTDHSHKKIGQGFQTGNLILRIPGVGALRRSPRRLFMGHMDTVPLCRGSVPVREGDRIVARGETALGGDNRTAVAAILSMVESLLAAETARPPITVLLTVGEEIGLLGARHVDLDDLGEPALGFNVDGGAPADIIIGAIGADRWEADVYGRSSHAGVHPEHGISATLITARAIADVADRGFFGKIEKGQQRGTANVGTVRGGEATNQVTDHVFVRGECRSHNRAFLHRITNTYRTSFERAAKSVRNNRRQHGRVDFRAERDYDAFRMSKTSAPVQIAQAAAAALGLDSRLVIANGGLDANYLNAKGVPTVTLGAGQHNPHTVDEYVDVQEFLDGCRLLVAIAHAP